jgi:hypothetical protein
MSLLEILISILIGGYCYLAVFMSKFTDSIAVRCPASIFWLTITQLEKNPVARLLS